MFPSRMKCFIKAPPPKNILPATTMPKSDYTYMHIEAESYAYMYTA